MFAKTERGSEFSPREGNYERIIDSHGHLGNILYSGGGELIFRKGVKKRFVVDIVNLAEWQLHRGIPGILYKLLSDPFTRVGRERNETATLENLQDLDVQGRGGQDGLPPCPSVRDL